MAAWQDNWCALIRGNETGHVDDEEYDEVIIAIAGAAPDVTYIGAIEQDGDLSLVGSTVLREGIIMKLAPQTVQAAVYPELQSQGWTWRLRRYVLPHTHVWVMWLRLVGSNADSDAPPRARVTDPTTFAEDNHFWVNEYTFPWKCQRDGDIRPSPDFASGLEQLELKLLAAEVE